jgi:hypothetical protein
VASGSGTDSMLRFRLERGGDGMKHFQKMKWIQQARLGSMERKCDTAQWHGDVDREEVHRGGEREETTLVGLT